MMTITENEFRQLADFIKSNYGIHLKDEKRTLVTGRLQQVLLQQGMKSFTEYFEYVLKDKSGTAVTDLINKITTNHTFFMREVDHFDYLKERALPNLIPHIKDKDLRIWSAGCSSGEEPYTLAILLDQFFGREKTWWDTKILATDISTKVLEAAVGGVYTQEQVASLPQAWSRMYFTRRDQETFVIQDKIKKEVIFRKFNLMDTTFPFKKKFHVIFCRNVMIYFDQRTKMELVERFYDSTEYGGYLFIGHSESIQREGSRYRYMMPAVYRKE